MESNYLQVDASKIWCNELALSKLGYSYKDLHNHTKKVLDYYKYFLPKLSTAMNEFHQLNKDTRYWEIILGFALYEILNVYYCKYEKLKNLKKNFDTLTVVKDISNIISNDVVELGERIRYDVLYNLQFYCYAAKNLNIKVVEKKHKKDLFYTFQESILKKEHDKSIKIYLKDIIKKLKNSFFSRKGIYFCDFELIYHQKSWWHSIYSFFAYLPFVELKNEAGLWRHSFEKNTSLRDKLLSILSKNIKSSVDPFLEGFIVALSGELPTIYIEGFWDTKTTALEKFKHHSPKIIYSTVGWYVDELFKLWVAELLEQKVKLIGCQHGGGSRVCNQYKFYDYYEFSITDLCIFWHRDNINVSGKTYSYSSPKLIKKIDNKLNDNIVLFVSSETRKIDSNLLFELYENYENDQISFFNALHISIRKMFVYRKYHFNNELHQKIKKLFPEVRHDTYLAFQDSIQQAKIYVTDHISTTYAESLSLNKPTILVFRPELYEFSKEAAPIFKKFKKVGILHDTPERAAKHIENILFDTDEWWFCDEVQNAVKEFCNVFAFVSDNYLVDNIKALKAINKFI